MLKKIGSVKVLKSEVLLLVQQLVEEILKRYTPLQILLFGSAATGEMTNVSDLDVAVIVASEIQAKQCKKALYGLAGRLGWSVDVLVYSRDDFVHRAEIGGVCAVIRDEGQLIWEVKA